MPLLQAPCAKTAEESLTTTVFAIRREGVVTPIWLYFFSVPISGMISMGRRNSSSKSTCRSLKG
jgi:hypothetical protein